MGITFSTIFPSDPADPTIERTLVFGFGVPAGGDFIGLSSVLGFRTAASSLETCSSMGIGPWLPTLRFRNLARSPCWEWGSWLQDGRLALRRSAARDPNVRLGPHALVTVTESRRATRTEGLLHLHEARSRVELTRRSNPDACRARRAAGARRTLRRPPVDDRRTCRGHGRQDQVAAGDRLWRATATSPPSCGDSRALVPALTAGVSPFVVSWNTLP